MTKRPYMSNLPDAILARGGGNATAAGVDFQAKLGAWLTAQLLAERPLEARLTGRRLISLRFETEAPVDDILVETDGGWIFVQAKTSLTLSDIPKSDLTKTANQFVRQWLACSTGNGDRGWNRPLQPDRDRLVLALGPSASRSLSVDLAQGLAALQTAGSAPLPKSKDTAVRTFNGLLERAWKAVTGRPATTEDIRAISNLVTILTFDFDGADRKTAEEILSHALDAPAQAGTAFSTIAMHCQKLMRQRTGCDMPGLRSELLAIGVPLNAPPSYHSDVAKLRAYSEQVRKQLSDYETTKVAGVQICIDRQCTNAVVNAARADSLLLVGEPGAGKSAVINTSATKLRDEGHDVLELAVDRLPVKSLHELATELGLVHPLRDVLLNWPGDKPAFLFIDALDATRGGENEAVFRTLMSDVLSFETRQWRVIASIRTFDLRLGEQFRHLFSGHPPDEQFADQAFPDVVHIHVPPWTPAELGKLLQDAPMLATAIAAGGERLSELALVPFNTRLLADLISGGLAPTAFGEIHNQVQLLGLYWKNRIEKHGTSAELCVEAAVAKMIESRSLRVRKLDAARPAAAAFDALLHDYVLVQLKEEQFVAFRHHILFDYAASRVYLRTDDLDHTANLLTFRNGLGLMLAPALGFALQQLWNDVGANHRLFWDAIIKFSGDPACDPVVRSVAARTASELPRILGDTIRLLAGLSVSSETKTRSVTALSHVIGALIVRFEDKQPVSLDPWCELAEQASEHIEDTVWPLRALLYALYERISSDVHRAQLGRAARNILAYSLALPNATTQLTASAIDFVAETYASDIDASRQLLQQLFEPTHFQNHADQEIRWLTQRLKTINRVDPDFVADIYTKAFTTSITDDSETSIGNSQILPLSSNRRQDYESALWSLKEFFPDFLKTHPLHAVRALTQVISGYVAQTHPISENEQIWCIPTSAGNIRLQEDRSFIWAWDINEEHGDNVHGLIKEYVKYIEAAEPDVARTMIQEIILRNELALLWSRTLLAASKRPEMVGDLLWPIATQELFLTSIDTQKDAIDFIAARYPFEDVTSRTTFECAAMRFKFEKDEEPEELRRIFLEKLLSCIGEKYLATNDARNLLAKGDATSHSRTLNKRHFSVDVRTSTPDKWWWFKREGIDLDDPRVASILNDIDNFKKTLGLENRGDEVADVATAIDCVNALLAKATSETDNIHKSVVDYANGIAAEGLAKLSGLPVERLREQGATIPSLIALVIRLAETPVDPTSAEGEANFELSAGWGSPNTRVDTAEAVMQLCRVEGTSVEKLRPTMEMLLRTPNHPAARMQIAERLTVLWNSARPLMWELADRVARTEQNRGVLRYFANYFLRRTIHVAPERVEQLAFIIYERKFNPTDKATKLLFEEIGVLIALLSISHACDKSRRLLQTWIEDPHTVEAELSHAITTAGNALVLKYQKDDAGDTEIAQRAQDFFATAVSAMASGLECYLEDVKQRNQTEIEMERGTLYAKLLDQLCSRIYFASGAFRSRERDEVSLDTDEAKRSFLIDIQPMLVRIADTGTPSTIHHLIELLDFLLTADPVAVFDLVARALLVAGRRHGYQFESLGADRFVKIVGRYLADYRDLFTDDERRKKLVTCLDTFMEAGWPAARRLLYRLPEIL